MFQNVDVFFAQEELHLPELPNFGTSLFWEWIISIVSIAIIIRVIQSIFKIFELLCDHKICRLFGIKKIALETLLFNRGFYRLFCYIFFCYENKVEISDQFLSMIVGTAELLILPILIKMGKYNFIGAWLVLKAASNWNVWQKSRVVFNRFLLGTILSLMGSFCIYYYIFVKQTGDKIFHFIFAIGIVFSSSFFVILLGFLFKVIFQVRQNKKEGIMGRKEDEHFDMYWKYATHLRNWFIAYGIGGVILFVKYAKVFASLTSDIKREIVGCFLLGIGLQVLIAFINKTTQWVIYSKYADKESLTYKFFDWLSNQFWIDVAIDVATFISFAYATIYLLYKMA